MLKPSYLHLALDQTVTYHTLECETIHVPVNFK